ncbi:MAG: hypothetical protein KAF91_00815 [Nostoc sp. TH1S01]|nr:hypothetical protein [Nostoc sp. TH1S01]
MTSEERHELEKKFAFELAAFRGYKVDPELVHTDPSASYWLNLARELLDAVEKVIS